VRSAVLELDPATGMYVVSFGDVDWVTYTRAARRFAEWAFPHPLDEASEDLRVEGLTFVCEYLSDALAYGLHSAHARVEA
jgi:hypothetical protein